jgi:hypothetical protein
VCVWLCIDSVVWCVVGSPAVLQIVCETCKHKQCKRVVGCAWAAARRNRECTRIFNLYMYEGRLLHMQAKHRPISWTFPIHCGGTATQPCSNTNISSRSSTGAAVARPLVGALPRGIVDEVLLAGATRNRHLPSAGAPHPHRGGCPPPPRAQRATPHRRVQSGE